MKKGYLELVVFCSGAVVMVLELVAARTIAPYFGTSLVIWTSLIGVILGSLSLGYWLGGQLADKKAEPRILAWILWCGAITIAVTVLIKEIFLSEISLIFPDLRVSSVVATLFLFAPTSILLGMVSPYTVKLKLKYLERTGRAVGNLSALSTLGSIFGTFLAGFFLIAWLGHTQLLIALSLTLLLLSFLTASNKWLPGRLLTLFICLSLFPLQKAVSASFSQRKGHDLDTAYNRVLIYEDTDPESRRPIRRMSISHENSSAMFLDGDDLVFKYTRFYDLGAHFVPGFKKTLLLGGAAYSYPKHFLLTYPKAEIEVVEIDPGLTRLAQKYFGLKANNRLRIDHQDGRVFLNQNRQTYDLIFGDAFQSFYSVPYQLTTREAVQRMSESLTPGGAALVNIISSIEGDTGQFLRAEYATYKSVFPQVYIIPVTYPDEGETIQNLMLVALKSETTASFSSSDPLLNSYLTNRWSAPIVEDMPVLTDELAPVDQYIRKLM